MPEGLSPEEEQKAADNYKDYKESVAERGEARRNQLGAYSELEKTVLKANATNSDQANLDLKEAWKKVGASDERYRNSLSQPGANLAEAKKHLDEHRSEYIETARQDAEAAGHEIKLSGDAPTSSEAAPGEAKSDQ